MSLQIERLDFKPWGCFENHSLGFSTQAGIVDLIHGPNAAGKSTTSRGERSLLYGIDQRTSDAHTFAYQDLRIGARLVMDGGTVELVRRKGRVATLRDADDQPLAIDPISPAMGGLSQEVYLSLFQITHDTLVHGGAELLQGEGEVGASLFAAAAGISTLHGTLAEIDAVAEGIFNPRGRATKLHKAIAQLRDAEKRLRAATLRPLRHREMESTLGHAQDACEQLSREIRELEAGARGIERKRATAPLFDDHARLAHELGTLDGTSDLSPMAAEERVATQAALSSGAAQLERAQDTAANLAGRISLIEVDEALLARADEIRAAHDDVSATRKAAEDRRKREGELQEARAGLRAAAATIGVSAEAVEDLRRPEPARRALDGSLREHGELVERRRLARERVEAAQARSDDDQSALDGTPAARDAGALAAAVRAAVKAGPLSAGLAEARAETQRISREADDALARLHPAPANVESLRLLPAPPREAITSAIAGHMELERDHAAAIADRQRLYTDTRELDERREQLHLEGEVPTAERLRDARSQRGERWSDVCAALEGTMPAEPDLAEGFERELVESDRVADARAERAAQIECAAQIEAHGRRLERDHIALDERELALGERRASFASGWAQAWSPSRLQAPEPHDALAWLNDRDAVLELARTARASDATAQAIAEQAQTHMRALGTRLEELAIPASTETGLDELIVLGEAEVSRVQELVRARSALDAALARSEGELAAGQRDLKRAEDAWSAWESVWPMRREQGGLPASVHPGAAYEILRAVDEGLAHTARIADLERRIDGIDRDQACFEQRVVELCAVVACDLACDDAERSAGTLIARLDEAESQQARRASVTEQLVEAEAEVRRVERELTQAQAKLDGLLLSAGCEEAAELPEIERRSARARELRCEIAQLEYQIAQVGEGRFEALVLDAEGFDRAAAMTAVDDLHERVEALREDRDTQKERIGQRKRELEEGEADVSAVEAAQEVALASAKIRDLAVTHAKAKLAAAVVRRAIERYRRLHQDPLLRRANELFARFTHGSFVELFVDVDSRDVAVLVGRQRDRVLKHVPQMSDGTREQLFLALRIAAIERYVATSGPVPVVFDDVFLESDEPRSERIFEALGELATKTQVIVLTHHHHLIDVAKRALGDKLVVQDLPDAAPILRPAAAAVA